MPPFINDNIPSDQIDKFQEKGIQGWNYMTQQILQSNMREKIDLLKRDKKEPFKKNTNHQYSNSSQSQRKDLLPGKTEHMNSQGTFGIIEEHTRKDPHRNRTQNGHRGGSRKIMTTNRKAVSTLAVDRIQNNSG